MQDDALLPMQKERGMREGSILQIRPGDLSDSEGFASRMLRT